MTARSCGAALRRTALLLLFGAGLARVTRAQGPVAAVDSLLASAVTAFAGGDEYAGIRWPRVTDVADELQRVYAAREFTPLWSRGGVPTRTAAALIMALDSIAARGLDPDDFDVARLNAMLVPTFATPAAQAAFDLTMSIAGLRAIRSLRSGRISAGEAHARLQFPQDTVDFAEELRSLALSPSPSLVLDEQEPPYLHYQLLKGALAVYLRQAPSDSLARLRVKQIGLTLERWRWLPHRFTTPPVIVNIPAFRLYALASERDRESEMVTMDVVVGDAFGHRTPVFSGALQYIVFAPYWDVPRSIAMAELVPLAVNDPHLLEVNNYEIVDARDKPLKANAASVRRVIAGSARIRQLPGGTNALGRVKFMFPNEFDVYLHDTPVHAAFERERRDISHGCIRIADPAALARLLLRGSSDWDAAAIERAMNARDAQRVDLPTPIPVHIVYATAVTKESGQTLFYDDIYGLDAELAAQLAGGYPYRR